jgi:hypothetical protein
MKLKTKVFRNPMTIKKRMTANPPFDLGQRRGGNELDSVLPFYKNSQVSPNLHRVTHQCQTNSALIPSIVLSFAC